MKYFLDTEFIEGKKSLDLISVGIISEDNRCYYAQRAECDLTKAGVWVKGHVIPLLQSCPEGYNPNACAALHDDCVWRSDFNIRADILEFVGSERPQFWGYYADYDWVALCWLFGSMLDLPKGWPMYCMDLKQFCVHKGDPRLPKQNNGEHNALMDARWNKQIWEYLNQLPYVEV